MNLIDDLARKLVVHYQLFGQTKRAPQIYAGKIQMAEFRRLRLYQANVVVDEMPPRNQVMGMTVYEVLEEDHLRVV